MSLTVSNTLTGKREEFDPLEPDSVTLYYCGLTVSDNAHLGHARSWVHTDVIHRWLEHLGYSVRHIENFTDVNEKIVARVGKYGDDEESVARHFIGNVLRDMRSLNLKRVDVYPRVSEHIPEIISMIEALIERGYAYESDGSVYFDVTAFPDYGQLSNQSIDDIEPEQNDASEDKRHPQDFALWKAGGVEPTAVAQHQGDTEISPDTAATTALTFNSPWGQGRPGWHIECSAMATTHLGDTFDIHVAGHDILFPHNENEIAQAVAATDGNYANYWLHTGMLRTQGEKMSSSLDNFTRVAEALDEYGPDVLRTFFLSSVYSADQTLSEDALDEARERWKRLRRAYEQADNITTDPRAGTKPVDSQLRNTIANARKAFNTAMNDDFNTRKAMAALLEVATAINTHIDTVESFDYPGLKGAIDVFESYGREVFGLSFGKQTAGQVHLVDDLVEVILEMREHERQIGNYDRADALRTELEALGIVVEDGDDGTSYRFQS